ncbi:MAG: trypsin-like peptidase domain-containing protein [Prevotella sp.]|nr:trypsin-like peptidase domain-containing protein [Prevotella sp.]
MKKITKNILSAVGVIALALGTSFTFCTVEKAMAASPAAVAGQPIDLTVAAEKALPCVVHIKYLQNSKVREVEVQSDPFGDMFDPFGFFGQRQQTPQKRKVQTPKKEATGSGVLISSDGYIVTNNHVVEGADELTVTLNDNREFSARIIGTDKNTDLALIKVNATGLPAIKVISSDDIKVGEWVLAIGHPLNLRATVTAGIVSAKARSLGANGVEAFIQTDAAINQGNSGGALVNANGELIGINAMLTSPTGSNIGYGFAIPTTIMNKVVADLKEYGTVQRGLIGIQGQDARSYIDSQKEQGKEIDLGTNEGIYVAKVVEDGAAADAGIEEGDVITAVDGQKVTKMAELQEILATKRPGDKVTLSYLHKKSKKTASVVLKNEQGNTKVVKDADLDVLGAVIREVNESEKADLDIKYGLKVTKVNSGKFRERGIPVGFVIQTVNEETMKTLSDLNEVVKAANKSKDPVLYIKGLYPSGKKEYFSVPLEETK